MELTAQDISDMLKAGENAFIEFKECGKTFPKEAWPTYSAFANTHGGWIILGIKEIAERALPDKFEIAGVNDPAKILQDMGSMLDNPQKVSRNLLTDDDCKTIDVDGKRVIVIHVPEADYRNKPIFLHGNKVNHSYKRTQQGDSHLTDEELAIMLRDADTGDSDFKLMEHYGMDDIDPDTLRKYRTAFNIRNPGHVFSDKSDIDFLTHMGAYVRDRATGREGLSLAGLMMFGKGLAIRERFPSLRMDYLDLSNIPVGSGIKWNERLTYDGSWENNLYNFITFVMSRVTFGIPTPGVVRGAIRNDDSQILKALREAITNSVIHADFRIEGVLRIDKREDSVIIRNPGLLKLSKEKIYNGNHTRARNPKIQDMLRMIGFGDNIGSGFPLILEAWREESWVKPELDEDRDLHIVSLSLKMSSLYAPDVMADVLRLYGDSFDFLSADEKECLILIFAGQAKSNSDLQSLTGKNSWEMNRLLTSLVNKKFIISNPNGRWTTYVPNPDFKAKWSDREINREISREINKENNREIIPSDVWGKLSDVQRLMIDLVIDNPQITLSEIAVRLSASVMNIRYQRVKMERLGIFFVHNGPTKKGVWKISYRDLQNNG